MNRKRANRAALDRLGLFVFTLMLGLTFITGCEDRPGIRTHRIKLKQSDDAKMPPMMQNAGAKQGQRMVVAFIENDDATWYFKIRGDANAVKKFEPQWMAYLKSIKFNDAGDPEGDVPESWTEGRQKMMVAKTYNIGDDADPLQLDISSLSAGQDLTLNVNRWLGQLGLPGVGPAQVNSLLSQLESKAGSMRLFDRSTGESAISTANGNVANDGAKNDSANIPPMMRNNPSSTKDQRMVVAFIENGDATWFFKVRGNPAAVKKYEPQWSGYLKSISFTDAGEPEGNVPESWTEGRPKMMVDKTYNMGDETEPLQLDISALASGQDLALNVNRWLGQLGLPPVEPDKVATALTQLESKAGTMWLFDRSTGGDKESGETDNAEEGSAESEAGQGSAGHGEAGRGDSGDSDTGDSEAGNRDDSAKTDGSSDTEQSDSKLPFAYQAPSSWEKGNVNSVVLLRYHKKSADDENKMASISVSVLPADINEWVPNVQRWCGEIDLEAYSPADIEAKTQTIKIGSLDAQRIDLVSDKPDGESRYAVMLKHDGQAWFFKMYGNKQLVADHASDFDAFLNSIKFDQ